MAKNEPEGLNFLEFLRELLQEVGEISKEERDEAISLIKEHYKLNKNGVSVSGACINCGAYTNYRNIAHSHLKMGDSWLRQKIKIWKRPAVIEVSGRAYNINGISEKTIHGYSCDDCLEEYKQLIENFKTQDLEKRTEAARKTREEELEILRGDRRATAAKRFWILTKYITEDDCQNLATLPYKDFLSSRYWDIVRKYKLYRTGYACELCNSKERLQVHHRTYEHRGREYEYIKEDLVTLCETCHARHHDKLGRGTS